MTGALVDAQWAELQIKITPQGLRVQLMTSEQCTHPAEFGSTGYSAMMRSSTLTIGKGLDTPAVCLALLHSSLNASIGSIEAAHHAAGTEIDLEIPAGTAYEKGFRLR